MKIVMANPRVIQLTLELQGVAQVLDSLERNKVADSSYMVAKFVLEKILAEKKLETLYNFSEKYDGVKFEKLEVVEIGNGNLAIVAHQNGDSEEEKELMLEDLKEELDLRNKHAELFLKWVSYATTYPSVVAAAIANAVDYEGYVQGLESL
jgi:hypothetical protein